MKKTSAALVALCLSLWVTGCAPAGEAPAVSTEPEASASAENSAAQEEKMITGAYGEQKDLTEEDRALFESLLPSEEGDTQYELLSVAKQVVSGTNYRFHVKVTEGGEESEAMIVIYQPLPSSGKEPSVTSIELIPEK